MQKQESRSASRGQSPQPESASPGAYFLSGEEASRLQRQKQGRSSPDYRSDSQDRHQEPGTRPGGQEGSGSRTKYEKMNGYHGNTSRDSLSSRDRASPSLPDRGRFSPSSHDRRSPTQAGRSRSPRDDYSPVIRGGPPGSGRPSLNISRDRLSSDGRESSSRRDDPNTSLPRPRRHSHDFRDHKMRKHPGGGSRQSLDDSGISDQEQGALANLPGPGKFKQMTKQRGADDVDSGFIGSVVGSDVTRPLPQQQQQQQQQQQSLRLRHPGDSGRRNRASGVRSGADTSTSDTGRGRSRSTRDSESDHRDSSMQNDSIEVTASFMDDPTETEVSKSDRGQRSQKRQGRDNRNVGRHDQTSEGYSGEEDTDATPKPSTRLKISQKSENKESTSPSKHQRKSRTLVSEEEEEITPRATPTRGMQVSRYVSSSDMETPRSVQARTRQTAPPRSGVSRAPPAGRQLDRTEEHAVKGRESLLKSNLQQRTEDRGVGSDRGHESDATRVSSASGSRLRALQDEVERLKERVEQAVESPPQAPLPPPQSQPEYYDPFDDPYGFMRMPRRRANSFSGTNAREWDEWYWTLPNQRRNDGSDIPLGYAAADAYADVPPPQAAESPARSRIRRRRMERMKKTEQGKKPNPASGPTEHPPEAFAGPGIVLGAHPGVASQPGVAGHPGAHPAGHPAAHPGAQPATHPGLRAGAIPGAVGGSVGAPSSPRDGDGAGLYEYYVPSRYSTQGMRQQLASKGYFRTPSGAKIYANQQQGGPQVPGYHPGIPHGHPPPQYAYGNYGGGHASRGYQSDTASMHPGTNRPFYTIRRSSNRPVFSMPRSRPVMQSYYEDYDSVDGRSGYQTDPGIGAGSQTWRQRSYVVEAALCPLCGGSGEHTHAEYEGGDNLQYHTREFVTERSSRPHRRSRSASRSTSRSHHFSPERSSSYWIREFRETSSDDTDEEVYSRRRRSRSLSRTRRKTRKYRKVHGSYSDRDVDRDDSLDVDLNESLNLSEDIRGLTRRMLRSVRSGLRSYKRRDFGSSEW